MKKRKALHWEQLEMEKEKSHVREVQIARHGRTVFTVVFDESEVGKVTQLYRLEHGNGKRPQTPLGNLIEQWEGKNTTLAKQRAFEIATR